MHKNVLLYANLVLDLKYQKEFGKIGKIKEDLLKFLLLDINKNVVSLGTNVNIVQKVVRWERQTVYFDAFIDLATIHIWINKILLVG